MAWDAAAWCNSLLYRMFCPHLVLSHIFYSSRRPFNELMLGDLDCDAGNVPQQLWDEVDLMQDSRVENHQMQRRHVQGHGALADQ